MESNEEKKPIYKKWWFWLIIVVVVIGMFGNTNDTINTTNTTNITNEITNEVIENTEKEVYTIKGEEIGEYGREVVLNANTDMPVTKYLYKLPAGTYIVTTDFEKMVSFYIVKDKTTTEEDNTEYPEVLDYVSEAYMLTNGDNDFNGHASKSVEITLGEDESISLVGTNTLILEKK